MGVLASVKASVGTINLKGEPGQRKKAWRLWRERLERAMRWMAVSDMDKLDLFLLMGGEDNNNNNNNTLFHPIIYKK